MQRMIITRREYRSLYHLETDAGSVAVLTLLLCKIYFIVLVILPCKLKKLTIELGQISLFE